MRGWLFVLGLLVPPAMAAAQPTVRPPQTAPATVSGEDCPENASPASSVGTVLAVVREASDFVGPPVPCLTMMRQRGSLLNVSNALRELGCKEGSACVVKAVLDQIAEEKRLPPELLYAVAWTESNWTQWRRDGRPVISRTGDIGLLQLNARAWGRKYDMAQVREDLLYNARAGAHVVAWAYAIAKRNGYKGDDLFRATYSIFNGGPGSHGRWKRQSRWSKHDRNFHLVLTRKPWRAGVASCGTI